MCERKHIMFKEIKPFILRKVIEINLGLYQYCCRRYFLTWESNEIFSRKKNPFFINYKWMNADGQILP